MDFIPNKILPKRYKKTSKFLNSYSNFCKPKVAKSPLNNNNNKIKNCLKKPIEGHVSPPSPILFGVKGENEPKGEKMIDKKISRLKYAYNKCKRKFEPRQNIDGCKKHDSLFKILNFHSSPSIIKENQDTHENRKISQKNQLQIRFI